MVKLLKTKEKVASEREKQKTKHKHITSSLSSPQSKNDMTADFC